VNKPAFLEHPSPFAATTKMARKFDCHGYPQECEFDVEHIDLATAQVEDIIQLCMAPEPLKLCLELRDLAGIHWDHGPEKAVYVIGRPDADTCKIGVAKNPKKRFDQLQTGSPHKLKIHALFWVLDGWAERVESAALKTAKAMGIRLSGEWIDGTPEMAALLIASAIKAGHVKVADSAMMIRQREAIRNERRNWI
jgi:hypothetical protein